MIDCFTGMPAGAYAAEQDGLSSQMLTEQSSAGFSYVDFSNVPFSDSALDSILAPLTTFLANNPFIDLVRGISALDLLITSTVLSLVVIILVIALVTVSSSAHKIRQLIKYDRLTGLPSSDEFDERVKAILRQNPDKRFAFVFCDINRFKFINETYGYDEGDDLLRTMAKMLTDFLDPHKPELVSRASADNFILLINYINKEDLHRRLNASPLIKESSFHTRDAGYHFSISSGVYLYEPGDDPEAIDAYIVHAHYAKDQAKRILKNNLVTYDTRLRDHIAHEKEVENKMYSALDNEHFVPYYQAKIDVFTGKTVGAEALARWIDPEKGLVSPAEFIPYFEKSGFIVTLDVYMFEKVCEQVARWMEEGYEIVRVSCNFSRTHINNPELPAQLLEIANKHNVPPELLEIEITESVAMELDKGVMRFVKTLRKHGFKLAIDDFGTGFSSLAVLNQIEMDILKLDRSFFTESVSEDTGLTIIRSLVDLARDLDVDVVCEGIETEDQIETMKSVDCHVAQGFYYSRPAPAKEFEAFLSKKGASEDAPAPTILLN